MKRNKTVRLGKVLRSAGAYIAFEIGSGFATGQEILQFYSAYGIWSVGGTLISMVLFAWAGSRVMVLGHTYGEEAADRPYAFLCGPYLGRCVGCFVLFYLFASLSVMLAGAEASLRTYTGISGGGLLMAGLVLMTFVFGFQKLVSVVGLMGPVIIAVTGLVAICSLLSPLDDAVWALVDFGRFADLRPVKTWWGSGVLYTAYNMVGSMSFLMALGREAASAKEAAAGGVLGGCLLMITAFTLNLALLCNASSTGQPVPALYLAQRISPVLGGVFVVVLFCGIFSTAAPILWTLCARLPKKYRSASIILAALICLDALVLGQMPFERLVGTVYPCAGYLGVILLVCIALWPRLTAGKYRNGRSGAEAAVLPVPDRRI